MSAYAALIAIIADLLLFPVLDSSARAEPPASVDTIVLGDRGLVPTTPVPTPAKEGAAESLEVSARGAFASDYIYRGVTLSDHKPTVGAGIEAALGALYAGTTFSSVKLPNQPAVELATSAGLRPNLWNINWDFAWNYYAYPGMHSGPSVDYWTVSGRADTKLTQSLSVAAEFAYAPNYSNTGAWSKYGAFGVSVDLPQTGLLQDVTASVTAGVGYSWFGNQSAALGGFAPPAYLNWNAGVTLKRKIFSLDLRYFDTNLSKENCFVFTGDPNATPGGQVNPVTNPQGLISGLCRATFVAKFEFELE